MQDFLQDLIIRRAVVGWVAQEEALPEAHFELGPERGLVGHAVPRERADRGHGARGVGYERADCRRGRVPAVGDVADEDADHFVDGGIVSSRGSVENGGAAPSADADEGREVVDEEEIVVHFEVPRFEEGSAFLGEQVSKVLRVEVRGRQGLRRDRRERSRARRLDSD